MKPTSLKNFQKAVLDWFKQYGRKNLPWQQSPAPYPVWVSEIMLQQTQVKTVIPYYKRFMMRFPTLKALANAPSDTVLQQWSGLGYYARARNLHKSALTILSKYKGVFPNTFEEIISLPGIGRSTAGAILAFSFHKPYPILDGNIKRVLARFTGTTGNLMKPATQKQLWKIAEHYTPSSHTALYNQAMMDIGALICTKENPNCHFCPLQKWCIAYQNNLQSHIPTFNLQRKRPLKKVFFLMCCYKNKILLEKRPSKGIWGGLWSFPERVATPCKERETRNDGLEAMAIKWLAKNKLQLEIHSCRAWPSFTHAFTHFKLTITPIQSIIAQQRQTPLPQNLSWFRLKETASLGVPSPSRKLIKQLQQEELLWHSAAR